MKRPYRISILKWIIVLSLLPLLAYADQKEGDNGAPTEPDNKLDGGGGSGKGGEKEFVARYMSTKDPPLQLDHFEMCDQAECSQICGTKDVKRGFCEQKNNKLCMCATDNFMSTNVDGTIVPVNREDDHERNCSVACNMRNSYARIWHKNDDTRNCICLLNQLTLNGTTLCDEFALKDICKSVCKNDSAVCAFNGVCLCRQSWPAAFSGELEHTRKEIESDNKACTKKCREYHSEYVARLYDTKMNVQGSKTYEFREKFCLCGEEIEPADPKAKQELIEQGFQECTDLKCKVRCGMNMLAECEPKFRRACLCPRANIFIGKFLWARIPSKQETVCLQTCKKFGLIPRVIEWNPFFEPQTDLLSGVYRKSRFQYLYDGKFCHCINLKNEPDVNQFRPCTNELCQWLCGHTRATCDERTRRVCLCQTHQMLGDLGRRPDPAETNCNVICRRNLADARILEVNWDVAPPGWTVAKAKFCGCVRPVSPSGLSHCEGMEGRDKCPEYCNSTTAYCTQRKFCACNVQPNILNNSLVRLPNGKEAEECGEVCRSWTWPVAEDHDNKPYIYDESRKDCVEHNNCPEVDTTPWTLTQPGALKAHIDALEETANAARKYCLCAKSNDVSQMPGIRFGMSLRSPGLTKSLQCIGNYTCVAVGQHVHIIA